ncbi:MAG TPA: indole-3-glycerol phosphate synthase TrpC [Pyrinomonadaceae bacterium]|nr:indole-3-glycerol phosphate synthase TrpC [Pyrinomonadaceae bacterium]
MSQTFLDTITTKTRGRIAAVKTPEYSRAMRRRAEKARDTARPHSFRDALNENSRANIIAEIKRASPSKGVINANIDPAVQARRYAAGGAAAISVLTEPDHFVGSICDLMNVRSAVDLPLLRKDFIVDEFQILEAAATGANAVLLIVAALSQEELASLRAFAEDELGLDALVEIHDANELDRAIDAGSTLIGVNNRDLHSLKVSLDTSRNLASRKTGGSIFVAESGLSARAEIDELRALGFDAFLIGETLMRSGDPAAILEELGA